MRAYDCIQLLYTVQHFILQTIITEQMTFVRQTVILVMMLMQIYSKLGKYQYSLLSMPSHSWTAKLC